jgi:hypothetical protein
MAAIRSIAYVSAGKIKNSKQRFSEAPAADLQRLQEPDEECLSERQSTTTHFVIEYSRQFE